MRINRDGPVGISDFLGSVLMLTVNKTPVQAFTPPSGLQRRELAPVNVCINCSENLTICSAPLKDYAIVQCLELLTTKVK